jgi:hypothetical protein
MAMSHTDLNPRIQKRLNGVRIQVIFSNYPDLI